MDKLLEFITALITSGVTKYPIASSVIMVIGILRVINKPLFSLLRQIAVLTPSPKDDKVIDDVEKSKVYKYVSYALDWFGSVKLPGQK